MTDPSPARAPDWLLGAWQRPLLRTADHDDVTTTVRYVQAPSRFADLRVPASRPAGVGGRALAQLDDRELLALAEQQGFAGHASAEGRVVTWSRAIDYQPPGPTPDVGLVVADGPDGLTEHGIHAGYLEQWTRLAGDAGARLALERPASPAAPPAILVVAGDHFVLARDRPGPLPPGAASLLECCRDGDRGDRLRWLDCEIAWGRLRHGPAPGAILLSTLPDREGAPLLPAPGFRFLEQGADGASFLVDAREQRWRLVDGDLATLRACELLAA